MHRFWSKSEAATNTPAALQPGARVISLDAFRGFDILAMVFVNYIAGMPGIPFALTHAPADMDGFTLTDVVFPGFLFIMGVAIPLALSKRMAEGASLLRLLKHVAVRTLALLFLGVLTVNEGRFSEAAAGMSQDLWYLLAYAAVFVLWAVTPKNITPRGVRVRLALKIAAGALLAVLLVLFRGQNPGGPVTWLQTSWWGILGIIGWTYFAASVLFLAGRGSQTSLVAAVGFCTALSIGARHGALDFLGPVNGIINVGSLFGSHTAIVAAGMLAGKLFVPGPKSASHKEQAGFLALLGAGLLLAGYILRPLHGFSKIGGTESYCLATAGISCLVLLALHLVLDVLKASQAAGWLVPAGRNPLFAYLLPDQVNNILGLAGGILHINLWQVLWPFRETGGLAGILNALAVTGLIMFLTSLATRARFVLKL